MPVVDLATAHAHATYLASSRINVEETSAVTATEAQLLTSWATRERRQNAQHRVPAVTLSVAASPAARSNADSSSASASAAAPTTLVPASKLLTQASRIFAAVEACEPAVIAAFGDARWPAANTDNDGNATTSTTSTSTTTTTTTSRGNRGRGSGGGRSLVGSLMAVRDAGAPILASATAQEAHDMALVAHVAARLARTPVVHAVLPGPTHAAAQVSTSLISSDVLASILALTADAAPDGNNGVNNTGSTSCPPATRAGASIATPTAMQRAFDLINERALRPETAAPYAFFEYTGPAAATTAIVTLAAGVAPALAHAAALTQDVARGIGGVGILAVRCLRPWQPQLFLEALPTSITTIVVLAESPDAPPSGSDSDSSDGNNLSALRVLTADVTTALHLGGVAGDIALRQLVLHTSSAHASPHPALVEAATAHRILQALAELSREHAQNALHLGAVTTPTGNTEHVDADCAVVAGSSMAVWNVGGATPFLHKQATEAVDTLLAKTTAGGVSSTSDRVASTSSDTATAATMTTAAPTSASPSSNSTTDRLLLPATVVSDAGRAGSAGRITCTTITPPSPTTTALSSLRALHVHTVVVADASLLFLPQVPLLASLAPGGRVVLCTDWAQDEVDFELPPAFKRDLLARNATLLIAPIQLQGDGVLDALGMRGDALQRVSLTRLPREADSPLLPAHHDEYTLPTPTPASLLFVPLCVDDGQLVSSGDASTQARVEAEATQPYVSLLRSLFGERFVLAHASTTAAHQHPSTTAAHQHPSTTATHQHSTNTSSTSSTPSLFNGAYTAGTDSTADVRAIFNASTDMCFGIYLARIHRRRALVRLVTSALAPPGLDMPANLRSALDLWLKHRNDADKSRRLGAVATQHLAAVHTRHPTLAAIFRAREHFPKPSRWILGADAWARDIGLSGLHHVIASGENVNVIVPEMEDYSSPRPELRREGRLKRDIALYAMNYGGVYVASIAVHAGASQAMRALAEADAFDGPAIIVAYAPPPTRRRQRQQEQQQQQQQQQQPSTTTTTAGGVKSSCLPTWHDWAQVTNDYRSAHFGKETARLSTDNTSYYSVFNTFEAMMPKDFIMDTVLPATNDAGRDIENFMPVQYGEFMRFLGLWFLFSCYQEEVPVFWSPTKSELFTAPRVNKYMTKKRFSDILAALSIVPLQAMPTTFTDRYAHMRPFVAAWNANMSKVYRSSWISVLDRVDCLYANKFHASEFMAVPKRCPPHQNSYFVLADGQTNVVYWAELDEGPARPAQLGPLPYTDVFEPNTARLLRCADQAGLVSTGKVVHVPSEYGSLLSMVELRKKHVYASVALSPGRPMPDVPQSAFEQYLREQPVGNTLCRPATCEEQPLYFAGVRDTANILMQLSTYGSIIPVGKHKHRMAGGTRVSFQYPEVVHNHLAVRRAARVNESLRHEWRPVEDVWLKKQFWHGHFAFFLGLAEANAYFVYTTFVQKKGGSAMTHTSFRKLLAKELMTNHYLAEEEEMMLAHEEGVTAGHMQVMKRAKVNAAHRLESIPFHSTWDGQAWQKTLKVQQVQRRCKYCKKKTRHYCVCTPAKSVCTSCFSKHMVEELT